MSISSQLEDLKKYALPHRMGSKNAIVYCYQIVKVYLNRIESFVHDLLKHREWRWKNTHYVNSQILKIQFLETKTHLLANSSTKHIKTNAAVKPILGHEKLFLNDSVATDIASNILLTPIFEPQAPFLANYATPHIVPAIANDPLKFTAADLTRAILQNSKFKTLYDQAAQNLKLFNNKNLEIEATGTTEAEKLFGACCDYQNGKIRINPNRPLDKAISLAIFELANMKNCRRFNDVNTRAWKKQLTVDEYAEQMERIEFDSIQEHIRVIDAASNEKDGQACLKFHMYKNAWKTVEAYLRAQLTTGHTDYYRRHFKALYQNRA